MAESRPLNHIKELLRFKEIYLVEYPRKFRGFEFEKNGC